MFRFVAVFAVVLFSLSAHAQTAAPASAPNQGFYTFTTPELPGKSAVFNVNGAPEFAYFLAKGKKAIPLPLPADRNLADLLAIVRANKSLKADDALFISRALVAWDSASATMGFTTTASGLEYKIIKKGTGKLPEAGKKVTVHYRGTLLDGRQFDSSFDRGQPISFTLGQRQVIAGWDEGIQLFPVGSRGRLRIPPGLAYGERGAGAVIPPNSTLIFDIEIVSAD